MSRMSLDTQVSLRCSFEYYNNALNYGCNEIFDFMLSKGRSVEYAAIQRRELRRRNGCDGSTKPIKLSPFILHTCPCNFLHPQFNRLMLIYEQYKLGRLYDRGCLADQPNQIIEIVEYIDYLKNVYRKEAEDKQRAKNGRQQSNSNFGSGKQDFQQKLARRAKGR